MRKILFALIGCFVAICAHAAQVVNVDYVHKLIAQKWDISVPIKTNNIMAVANMKYLLTAVDVANEILNGEKTTDYGNTEFATLQVADTVATIQAVDTLVRKEIEYKFFLTTTSTNSFSFSISAAGEFVIDWGDGTVETITKTNITDTTYTHNYDTSKSYTIKLTGQATAYGTSTSTTAISFSSSASKIASIDGSLGAIFGTLSSDTNNQPSFYGTFSGASNMTGSIPSDLFAGISGAPASYMFMSTFSGCSGLTGAIPDGLFAGISGAPASNMFRETFYGCSGLTGAIPDGLFGNLTGAPALQMFYRTFSGCGGLTGSIPAGLFGNLTGAPAWGMFYYTFYGCSGLTGAIPDGLFAGISGAPAPEMFYGTFYGCSGLTSIPENLFGNISGTSWQYMFSETFYNCTSLTGPSARINGQYLYEIWPNETKEEVGAMYSGATGLSDYIHIPVVWGGLGATTNEYPSAPSDAVYDFYLTTTSDTDVFAMQISAAGEFYIDWGDGKTEWVTKSNTTNMTFGHKYASKGAYNIRLGGQATAYNTNNTAAISFSSSASKIASIDGSLGAIFGTLSSGTEKQPGFNGTFSGASNMTGSIPSDLFAGISGRSYAMFNSTFSGCSGLTGAIPDGLFAGISGAPAMWMFSRTFEGCSGLTSIPDGLFAGISGKPASYMFQSTFEGCSGLTSIPENLFGNISGTAQSSMFTRTFYNCTSLTGPSARINGQYLYEIWPSATSLHVGDMYQNATKLDDYRCIPTVWGGGGEDCSAPTAEFTLTTTDDTDSFSFSISAAGEFVVDWGDGTVETITKPDTTNTTYSHNYDTANTYTIGIGGQATAYNTDEYTAAIKFIDTVDWEFESTGQIASINGSLGAIFGTLADGSQPRFCQTFYGAYNMNGAIPDNLFAGISGAPASYMFLDTFSDCRGLTSIPAGLFAGISGEPASSMFSGTFYGCSGLTGAIPDGLFGNLTGAPASNMFNGTFWGCTGLTSIPENLFGNISGTAQNGMFYNTFAYCRSLTGPSARINGKYLYEIWPSATSGQVSGMYSGATGLSDYLYIPVAWGGLGATTNEYPSAPSDAVYDFYLTTTSDTDMFAMQISAAGEFYIDWGDGKTEWVTKSDTTNMTFGHKYASKGAYNIRLGGQATAYNTSSSTAAISFYIGTENAKKIASIDGSLGAIFGTLSSDTNNQPRFYQTFYNAYYMKGSIPSDLFAGISGAPASNMFYQTFHGCSDLTSIPAGLFAGISGEPASSMFSGTFYGCSGLTSIPENLFGNISGTAQSNMFYRTFYNCTSLTGPSARINGQYLYEIWPSATSSQVGDMYYRATKLSDYYNIPTVWK